MPTPLDRNDVKDSPRDDAGDPATYDDLGRSDRLEDDHHVGDIADQGVGTAAERGVEAYRETETSFWSAFSIEAALTRK